MNKLVSLLLVVTTAASLASCGGPNSQTGAVLGALGGAAVGGIIGHQSGRGLEGAAIGGDAQDKRNEGYYRDGRYYPSERAYRDSQYYRGY